MAQRWGGYSEGGGLTGGAYTGAHAGPGGPNSPLGNLGISTSGNVLIGASRSVGKNSKGRIGGGIFVDPGRF